jgi:hypothetical protein
VTCVYVRSGTTLPKGNPLSYSLSPPRWAPRAAVLLGLLFALLAAPSLANANTLSVTQSGTDNAGCAVPCRHISFAATQANVGDTISVGSGTFNESQIVINKPLELRGAGIGQTIVDGQSAQTGNGGLIYLDHPTVGNIKIDGFTLQGGIKTSTAVNPNPEPFLVYAAGVPAGGTVTVSNNQLRENTTVDPELGSDYSVGFYSNGSSAEIHLADNHFQGMFQGAFIEGSTGASTISGNDFDGLLASNCQTPKDCSQGANLHYPNGVFLLADGGNVSSHQAIQGNTFQNTAGIGVAINAYGAGNNFSDMAISDNRIAGIGADDSTGRPDVGININSRAGAAISNVGVTGNDITMVGPGPSRAGILVSQSTGAPDGAGSTSGVSAHFNRIVGSFNYGVQNDAPTTVDATENWWGCNTGPNTSGCSATGGLGGAVTALPYLVLNASAAPSSVAQNQTSAITASLTNDSNGNTPAGNTFRSGVPVTFGTDLGTVSPASTVTTGPVASATFSSPTAGTANVKATIDNATVFAPVTVTGANPGPGPGPGPGPAAPTVSFSQPASGALLKVGKSTTVALNVSAPASPALVSVSFNGRQVCSITAAPYTCKFKPAANDAGRTGALRAVVTDAQNRAAAANRNVVVAGPVVLGSQSAKVRNGLAGVGIRCPAFGPCTGRITIRATIHRRGRSVVVTAGSARINLTGRGGKVQVPLSGAVLGTLSGRRYLNTRATLTSAGITSTRNLVLH